jgi:hypothetical protein
LSIRERNESARTKSRVSLATRFHTACDIGYPLSLV